MLLFRQSFTLNSNTLNATDMEVNQALVRSCQGQAGTQALTPALVALPFPSVSPLYYYRHVSVSL